MTAANHSRFVNIMARLEVPVIGSRAIFLLTVTDVLPRVWLAGWFFCGIRAVLLAIDGPL